MSHHAMHNPPPDAAGEPREPYKKPHPEACDVSEGDVQCPYLRPDADGERWLCCGLVKGHAAPHQDAYGNAAGEWIV